VTSVAPITKAMHVAPGYHVVATRRAASCLVGGDVSPSALRCFSRSSVYDPCWPLGAPTGVHAACLPSPWSHRVTRLKVGAGGISGLPITAHRGIAWGMTLADGTRCLAFQGAHSTVHGHVANWGCPHGLELLDKPNKQRPVWRIRTAHCATAGKRWTCTLGTAVRIAHAFYVKPVLTA
ncbi:MAG: hypothetical protein ACTHOK_02395, partial [Nocardioidaceae bacterium]